VVKPVNESLRCARRLTDIYGGNKDSIPDFTGNNAPEVATALEKFIENAPSVQDGKYYTEQLQRIKDLLDTNEKTDTKADTQGDTENPEWLVGY
jgi:hypothetical protein